MKDLLFPYYLWLIKIYLPAQFLDTFSTNQHNSSSENATAHERPFFPHYRCLITIYLPRVLLDSF
jgi:hypothetical protein